MINLVACYGNTGHEQRWLWPDLLEHGHANTRQRLEERYAAGSRRFLVWMPFGRMGDGGLPLDWDMDGYQECQRSSDPRLRRIAATYEPEIAQFMADHPDVQLYTYIGGWHDIDFKNREGKWSEYIHRFWRGCYPIVELSEQFPGRVGIAFDNSHKIPATHPIAGLMISLQALTQLPVMIEGGRHVERWQADAGFGRIMMSQFLDEGPVPDWPGEQIAWADNGRFSDMPEGWVEQMQEVGFTPCGK